VILDKDPSNDPNEPSSDEFLEQTGDPDPHSIAFSNHLSQEKGVLVNEGVEIVEKIKNIENVPVKKEKLRISPESPVPGWVPGSKSDPPSGSVPEPGSKPAASLLPSSGTEPVAGIVHAPGSKTTSGPVPGAAPSVELVEALNKAVQETGGEGRLVNVPNPGPNQSFQPGQPPPGKPMVPNNEQNPSESNGNTQNQKVIATYEPKARVEPIPNKDKNFFKELSNLPETNQGVLEPAQAQQLLNSAQQLGVEQALPQETYEDSKLIYSKLPGKTTETIDMTAAFAEDSLLKKVRNVA